jgi:hypothetical protein
MAIKKVLSRAAESHVTKRKQGELPVRAPATLLWWPFFSLKNRLKQPFLEQKTFNKI